MIPIKISSSKIKVRNSETGQFEEITIGAANLGDTNNIDDNADSPTTTWSSSKMREELDHVISMIETAKSWDVIVETEEGTNVYDGYRATLVAKVYHGNEDISDYFEEEAFTWYRESSDRNGDVVWNSKHNGHSRTLLITEDDTITNSITDFKCEVNISDYIVIKSD